MYTEIITISAGVAKLADKLVNKDYYDEKKRMEMLRRVNV